MSKVNPELALVGVAGLVGLGLIWWMTRPGAMQNAAASAAGAIVNAAQGAVVGTVKGVGQAVGIPDTNMTQCQKDMAAGNWWDASFSCPAGTFIAGGYNAATSAVFGSTALSAAEAADARRDFAATDPRRLDLPQSKPAYSPYDPMVSESGTDYRYF